MSYNRCAHAANENDINNISKALNIKYNKTIDGFVDTENKVLYIMEYQDNMTNDDFCAGEYNTIYKTVIERNCFGVSSLDGDENVEKLHTIGITHHRVLTEKACNNLKDYTGYHVVSVECYCDDGEAFYTSIPLNYTICGNEIVLDKGYKYINERGDVAYTYKDNYKYSRLRVEA